MRAREVTYVYVDLRCIGFTPNNRRIINGFMLYMLAVCGIEVFDVTKRPTLTKR